MILGSTFGPLWEALGSHLGSILGYLVDLFCVFLRGFVKGSIFERLWGVPGPAHVHFPGEGSQRSRVSQIGAELHFGAILGSILVPFGGLGGSKRIPRHLLGRVGFGVDF